MRMKRLAASLMVVSALALLPAQAATADILNLSAGVFPQDELTTLSSSGNSFAVGGGTDDLGTHFAFSAHPGPNGPSGYAVVSGPFGQAQGHVCAYLGISSNSTDFWIVVEKGSGILGSSPSLAIIVLDNGEPPSGAPDAFGVQAAPTCPSVNAFLRNVVQGNVVVKNR
jgi:hypothetical protein